LSSQFANNGVVNHTEFWRHSLSVAILAQRLALLRHDLKALNPDQVYIGGLFHDIGIIIFAIIELKKYRAIVGNAATQDLSLDELELKEFGVSHADIGAEFIMRHWGVNSDIGMAVKYHHNPFEAPIESRPIAIAIHLSNSFCNNEGISNGVSIPHSIFLEGAWEYLGLTLEDALVIYEDVKDSVAESELMIAN